jgi:hypothetical protein
MKPHRVMVVFELYILRVLSLNFIVAALICLFHRAWLTALMMALFWHFVGAIGQGLPHRKAQAFSKLSSGEIPQSRTGDISENETFAIVKATLQLAFMVGIAGMVVTWKLHQWYWAVASMVIGFILTVVISFSSVFLTVLFLRKEHKAMAPPISAL